MVSIPAVWVAHIPVDILLCYPTLAPPPPQLGILDYVSRKIPQFALRTNTAPPALSLCRRPWLTGTFVACNLPLETSRHLSINMSSQNKKISEIPCHSLRIYFIEVGSYVKESLMRHLSGIKCYRPVSSCIFIKFQIIFKNNVCLKEFSILSSKLIL